MATKEVLVWSTDDFSTQPPLPVGTSFTVTGLPDRMEFQDGPLLDERPTDFGPIDPDQYLVGTLDGTSFEAGVPGSVFEFERAFWIQGSDGSAFIVYLIHNTAGLAGTGTPTYGYVSEQNMRPGVTYTVVDADGTPNGVNPGNPGGETNPEYADLFVCFASDTLISTPDGQVPVQNLKVGDPVMTLDNGPQPIRWIGSRKLSRKQLKQSPSLFPVRIRAHALGDQLPARDLLVSPQHRLMIRSRIVERMFDCNEVLVAANKLLSLPGISVADDIDCVEYFHFIFDKHEVVFAENAPAESLLAGAQALKALDTAAVREILTLFPELANENHQPKPARQIPKGRLQSNLAIRHAKNLRALVELR